MFSYYSSSSYARTMKTERESWPAHRSAPGEFIFAGWFAALLLFNIGLTEARLITRPYLIRDQAGLNPPPPLRPPPLLLHRRSSWKYCPIIVNNPWRYEARGRKRTFFPVESAENFPTETGMARRPSRHRKPSGGTIPRPLSYRRRIGFGK